MTMTQNLEINRALALRSSTILWNGIKSGVYGLHAVDETDNDDEFGMHHPATN